MKSNDQIPDDEMALAEAIAAAKSRGLGFTMRRNTRGYWTSVLFRSKMTAKGEIPWR
jgi:hypothetical protein